MGVIQRILMGLGAMGAIAGVTLGVQVLRADALVKRLPPPSESTSPSDARFLSDRLTEALEIDPHSPDALTRRAEFYTLQKRHDEALGDLAAARQFSSGIRPLYREALIHNAMGRDGQARRTFERIRRLAPLDRTVVQQLLRMYRFDQDWESVGQISRDADARWPGVFDTTIGNGQQFLEPLDAELVLKYYFLAFNLPGSERNHPEPRVFDHAESRAVVETYLKSRGVRR